MVERPSGELVQQISEGVTGPNCIVFVYGRENLLQLTSKGNFLSLQNESILWDLKSFTFCIKPNPGQKFKIQVFLGRGEGGGLSEFKFGVLEKM